MDSIDTVAALVDHQAGTRGAEPFLYFARSGNALTYGDLADRLDAVGERLREWGLAPGDRVAVALGHPVEFAVWLLAGLASGLWVVPLDPGVAGASPASTDERAERLGARVIVADVAPEDRPRWRTPSTGPSSPPPAGPVGPTTGGVVLASSGTTGTPKVMALPVAQLLATARLVADHNELTPAERGFNPLPLWHVNAEVVGVLASLVAGASLVLDDRFHRTGFWKLIDDFGVTWINAVPAIIARLLTGDADQPRESAVRFVRSASAPLSPQLLERFEEVTGIPIIESYGMTEAASQICVNSLRGVRKPGSVGRPVGVALRVAGVADPGEVGPIEISGPTVIAAYDSPGYEDRFVDGWLRTGDLGYVDADGDVFIVGRDDDVINRGGEKIYPLEIEHVVAGAPGVGGVAVIGEADEVFGAVPVAYVRPYDPDVLESEAASAAFVADLRSFLRDRLARTSRPASVRLVAGFPAGPTGKIQKKALRGGDVFVVYEEAT